jgi:DNA-binding helix-hairpin-helix protein with protein kinase domain
MLAGILSPGEKIRIAPDKECRVDELLGAGGQGEVYRVTVQGSKFALKWYYAQTATRHQWDALRMLIDSRAAGTHFLWPTGLVTVDSKPGFGCIIPLCDSRYKGITDLLTRQVTSSLHVLTKVCANLSDAFMQLHSVGLCYRDISFGNVRFDPDSGDVLMVDNDNIGRDGEPASVLGTPRFMAPELLRNEAFPSAQTDLFALAVLLFLILMNHHPLEGRKEMEVDCFDQRTMVRLYGMEPVFIFDPVDHSNEPVPGYQDSVLAFWPIYPAFLRDLFTKSFTEGIRDPLHGRIRESAWRKAMTRLHDSIFYCRCGAENFYDADALRAAVGNLRDCWNCGSRPQLPARIRIGRAVVMLDPGSKLYRHHVQDDGPVNFAAPIAEVISHPTDATRLGLKNLDNRSWVAVSDDGVCEISPAKILTISAGTRINFGEAEGEIRILHTSYIGTYWR